MSKNDKWPKPAKPSVKDRLEVKRSVLERMVQLQDNGYNYGPTHLFPKKIYKYVDTEYYQAVQNGSIKIGTIRNYANLENGREDDAEGTSVVYPGTIDLKRGEGEEIRKGMREMGWHNYGETRIAGSVVFRAETPNYLCYCLSLTPRSKSLLENRNQTVFEIVSFDRFLLQLLTKLQVDVAWVGGVDYSPRVFAGFDAPGNKKPDAWRKPYRRESDGYRFDKERELRILMMPQENVITDAPYGPDPLLAPFFRKL